MKGILGFCESHRAKSTEGHSQSTTLIGSGVLGPLRVRVHLDNTQLYLSTLTKIPSMAMCSGPQQSKQ